MSARMPRGAWPIADARAAGQRPKHGVVVSFVGRLDIENPLVQAEPGERYDWSWAMGLDVLLLVKAGQDVSQALKALHPICRQVDVCDEQAKKGWMLCGFKPDGSPLSCRWLDRWTPNPRLYAWN